MKTELLQFQIYDLFHQFPLHDITFKDSATLVDEAKVVILTGGNGTGKTTILNMINGILKLDFSDFRRIPFSRAILKLTTNDEICISDDSKYLMVSFNGFETKLHKQHSGPLNEQERERVEELRKNALPVLSNVSFQKVDIHRSNYLQLRDIDKNQQAFIDQHGVRRVIKQDIVGKLQTSEENRSYLSNRVKNFVQEAQVDYKKYFISEGPELFPRILNRLRNPNPTISSSSQLLERLDFIKANEEEMSRFGLTMRISDIDQLIDLLKREDTDSQNVSVNAALEAYIETLETKNEERQLISSRLKKFEQLISKFIKDKSIYIDYSTGLTIKTCSGEKITELELSSGEYHLLYMMVTALVSTSTGTTIAIDEPELSLHISWQRDLIKTLASCSFGASPLLIFATHSAAISAEYYDKCVRLG